MAGAPIKLAFLLFLVANASVLVPLTAEAKCKEHKRPHPPTPLPSPTPVPLSSAPTPAPSEIPPYQINGCGDPCSDSNDCDSHCTVCCSDQTCCYEEPMFLPPSPLPVIEEPSPAPIVADEPVPFPTSYPPYQIHGCGHKCEDSNDCDWPCTECCYPQKRCC